MTLQALQKKCNFSINSPVPITFSIIFAEMAYTENKKLKSIKCIFWNSRSIKKRLAELQNILKNVDLFVCVESWLTPSDSNINFPGFVTFRQDRQQTRGGGILVLVRKNIAFKQIVNIKSPDDRVEVCGLQITNTCPNIDIIVCYRPPGFLMTQSQWDILTNNASANANTIFLGDFNSHNIIWNCYKNCTNGDRFYCSLENQDLFIHNINTSTHIDLYKGTKSNIDLLITSMAIADKINFHLDSETHGSDHYPIYFDINMERNYYVKKSFKLKTLRTDWSIFKTVLNNEYINFYSTEYDYLPANEKYNQFYSTIKNALAESTSKKKYKKNNKNCKFNPVPWWNTDCERIKRLRKAAFKKFEYTKNLIDLLEYKKNAAIAIKTFKKSKLDYFKRFAESINFGISISHVWNKCKVLKNKWAKVHHSHLSENLQNKNKVHTALEKLSPPWVCTNPRWTPECKINEFFNTNFNYTEFNTALESKNTNSSPGIDGIDYDVIKRLPIKFHLLLLDIFNEIYNTSIFPDSWKNTFVHFIEKPDGKSVRPIALTSCLSKLFETLIKNRLQWWCEYHDYLPKNQSGFRKGKSCYDNLVNLTLQINESFMNRKHVLAAFLDVRGAFDDVNSDILLSKLADIGCSSNVVKFVKFFTHERYIYSEFIKNHQCVYKGVPQGGVLSPLLYLIYVRNICDNLPKSVQVSQFADDIALYSKFSPFPKCRNTIEKSIEIVKTNFLDLGLELAPHKTILVNFNNNNIKPGEVEVKIDDITIKSSESVRFLGITFDYKLSFNQHINIILQKCTKATNLIKYLCGTWWGADPGTLVKLYKSYVRSIIEYGIFIFYPSQKILMQKIEKMQIAALRSAMGYRRTTPTNVILAETKVPLIEERTKLLCKSFIIKVMSSKKSLTHESIRKYHKKLMRSNKRRGRIKIMNDCIEQLIDQHLNLISYDVYNYDYQAFTSNISIDIDFGKYLSQLPYPNVYFNDFLLNENAYCIYTDGSKTDKSLSTGIACVCPNLNINITKSIDKRASIFTAECFALSVAFDLIIEYKRYNFCVFSDSLSVLESLKHSKFKNTINPNLLDIKNKYSLIEHENKNRIIKLFWIPSHSGLSGNELADKYAKLAGNSEATTQIKLPFTDFYEEYRRESRENTEIILREQAESKGKNYFKYFCNKRSKPWFDKLNLSRYQIVTISRCRSDHYNLAASLFKVNIITSQNCQCNCEQQDLNHIIWNCTLYEEQRTQLFQDLLKINLRFPLNVEVLIAEPNIDACRLLCKYFNKCNLNI